MPLPNPAVFLDRDDTILNTTTRTALTVSPGDLIDPALVELLPGAAAAIARFQGAGFAVVVISNQGSVARGLASLGQVELINDTFRKLLAPLPPLPVYYCPFHPKHPGNAFGLPHSWQKPGPGMFLAAAADLDLDLAASYTVGDKARDLAAGIAAGLRPDHCLLLDTTGEHARLTANPSALPASVQLCADLAAAADLIVQHSSDSKTRCSSVLPA